MARREIEITMSKQKHAGGRPSSYKPEYCERLISLMSQGFSLMASCGELGFTKQTAHNWAALNPEFFDAIALGHAKRSMFLEKRGLVAESGPAVTYVLKALPNCNPDEFRDKSNIEHSGTIDLSGPADDAKRKLAAIIAGSGAIAMAGKPE